LPVSASGLAPRFLQEFFTQESKDRDRFQSASDTPRLGSVLWSADTELIEGGMGFIQPKGKPTEGLDAKEVDRGGSGAEKVFARIHEPHRQNSDSFA
jgi:hypothetical protein